MQVTESITVLAILNIYSSVLKTQWQVIMGMSMYTRSNVRWCGLPLSPDKRFLSHVNKALSCFQLHQITICEKAFVPLLLKYHSAQEKYYLQNFYTPASLPDLWSWGHSARSSCSQGCGSSRSIYNWRCNRNGHCCRNTVFVSLSTILSP